MTRLQLQGHISYCLVGQERIFLDVSSDSYFRLSDRENTLFAELEVGADLLDSRFRPLIESGLLTDCGDGRPIAPSGHITPAASLLEQEQPRAATTFARIVEVGRDLLAARLLVSRRKLPTVGRFQGKPHRPHRHPIESSVGEFLAARRFVPLAPNCLRDSIALFRFLARRGIGAELVVGVKLYPFAAHCWVQQGPLVLNDNLDGAAGFSPILIL